MTEKPLNENERSLLQRFEHIAQQAYLLKHGQFPTGRLRRDGTENVVSMGSPNYYVKRLLFQLATLRPPNKV